jgi:CheY-like chemotaxis protein
LKALLEVYGFDVVVAENGEEAVKRAIVSEPDLVLMDVMMPRVDGIEATKRLRRSSEFRQVPILALSAMVGSRELALSAGCDDYLTKPIDIPALVAAIRGWLARGHTPTPTLNT